MVQYSEKRSHITSYIVHFVSLTQCWTAILHIFCDFALKGTIERIHKLQQATNEGREEGISYK